MSVLPSKSIRLARNQDPMVPSTPHERTVCSACLAEGPAALHTPMAFITRDCLFTGYLLCSLICCSSHMHAVDVIDNKGVGWLMHGPNVYNIQPMTAY